MQSQQDGVEDDGEGRRPKRRSNAGVHYSEDLSDAMFDRLLQSDDQPGSASEVTCPPPSTCAKHCRALPGNISHVMQDKGKQNAGIALVHLSSQAACRDGCLLAMPISGVFVQDVQWGQKQG